MPLRPRCRPLLTGWLLWLPIFCGSAAHAQQASPVPVAAGASVAANPAAPASQASAAQLAAARQFYERGEALFIQGRYDAAWVEFSSAYEIADLPELLFNLARSEEKLNRPADAAKHYRMFLERSPNDKDAANLRAKIARLEHPEGLPPPPVPTVVVAPVPPVAAPRRIPVYSAIAGGGTLLFTVIGAAAVGAASSKYGTFSTTCAPRCSMSDVLALQPTIQTGQAFLSLAAIGAVATVGLLVWELRRARPESKTTLRVSGLALSF